MKEKHEKSDFEKRNLGFTAEYCIQPGSSMVVQRTLTRPKCMWE